MNIETAARQSLYRQMRAPGGEVRGLLDRRLLRRIWTFSARHHRRLAAFVGVSVLSALPWVGLGAGMLINAWHSDRTQERYWHIGLPALLAALGLVLGSQVSPSGLALLCLCVGAFGLGSAQGAFWALPTGFLPPAVAASGITLINLLGSSGGLVAPPAIGWIRAQTGSFAVPVYALAGLLVLGAALLLVIRRSERPVADARTAASRPLTGESG